MNKLDLLKNKNKETAFDKKTGNQFVSMITEIFHYNIGVLLLGLLVMFFNYPLNLAMRLSNELERFGRLGMQYDSYRYSTQHISLAEDKLDYVMQNITNGILRGDEGSFIEIIIVIIAVISARAMFKHLFSRTDTDFYFSQPVSRIKRFAANYTSGLLMGAICMTVGYVMALMVAAGYKVENVEVYNTVLIHFGYFVMYALTYTVAVIAVIMTGNAFAAAGALLCFFFFLPAAEVIFVGLKSNYLSFYVYDNSYLSFMSPILLIGHYFERIRPEVAFPFALVRNTALVTAAMAVIGGLLYRLRPSEACGRAVAFTASKRPIRMILTVTAGLAALTQVGFAYNDNKTWTVFFVLLGIVIAHAILEIIINADVRALFKNKLEMAVCALLAFSVVLFYKFDCPGYDRYLPKKESIAAVAIETPADSFEERWEQRKAEYVYSFTNEESSEIKYSDEYWDNYPRLLEDGIMSTELAKDAALGIGREAIAQKEILGEVKDDVDMYTYIKFILNDGKVINRRYVLDRKKVGAELRSLFESDEYKEIMFPILAEEPEDIGAIGIELKSATAEAANITRLESLSADKDVILPVASNSPARQVLELSQDKAFAAELLSAMQQDIKNMKYDDYEDWWNSGGPTKDLIYYACDEAVKLYEMDKRTEDPDYIFYIDYVDVYPVFDSNVNTRRVLEKYGIELSK